MQNFPEIFRYVLVSASYKKIALKKLFLIWPRLFTKAPPNILIISFRNFSNEFTYKPNISCVVFPMNIFSQNEKPFHYLTDET